MNTDEATLDGQAYGTLWRDAAVQAASGYEFRSFLCGSVPPEGLSRESTEAWRRACNKVLARAIYEHWNRECDVDHLRPHIQVVLRRDPERVEVDAAPLFLMGRYRKLVRGLSQSPFHCVRCRGKGRLRGRLLTACPHCGGSGRVVERSVADFIVDRAMEAAGGTTVAFAACGREDIDVLMLGEGRPFALHIEQPHRRTLDLAALAEQVNAVAAGAVEFTDLRPTDRDGLKAITTAHPTKSYRARIVVEGGLSSADGKRIEEALTGATLDQRTPERVSSSRADLVRPRKVLELRVVLLPGGAADLVVRTEAGTYIKEMVTGDEGRTTPSVTSILGRAAQCVELDVLSVDLALPEEPI